MDIFVVYEGTRHRTGTVAQMVARRMSRGGIEATAIDLASDNDIDVALAHGLVAGCHARIDTPFGGEATKPLLTWIAGLPNLDGMPVAVFCTYRFFPYMFADVTTRTAEVLGGLEAAFDRRGGTIVSSHAIHRRHPDEGISALVTEFGSHLVA